MIEVQERGLSSFEQDVTTGRQLIVDKRHRVTNHGFESRTVFVEIFGLNILGLHGQSVVDLGENPIFLLERHFKFLAKDLLVEQILDAKSHPRRFVGVGGSDSTFGRSESIFSQEAFGHAVNFLVVRHDQVRIARHHERRRRYATIFESVNFGEQHPRVDHHTIANHWGDRWVQHSARNQL